jgi:hypothetical protein
MTRQTRAGSFVQLNQAQAPGRPEACPSNFPRGECTGGGEAVAYTSRAA